MLPALNAQLAQIDRTLLLVGGRTVFALLLIDLQSQTGVILRILYRQREGQGVQLTTLALHRLLLFRKRDAEGGRYREQAVAGIDRRLE